jgi:hypothetical protein
VLWNDCAKQPRCFVPQHDTLTLSRYRGLRDLVACSPATRFLLGLNDMVCPRRFRRSEPRRNRTSDEDLVPIPKSLTETRRDASRLSSIGDERIVRGSGTRDGN